MPAKGPPSIYTFIHLKENCSDFAHHSLKRVESYVEPILPQVVPFQSVSAGSGHFRVLKYEMWVRK